MKAGELVGQLVQVRAWHARHVHVREPRHVHIREPRHVHVGQGVQLQGGQGVQYLEKGRKLKGTVSRDLSKFQFRDTIALSKFKLYQLQSEDVNGIEF